MAGRSRGGNASAAQFAGEVIVFSEFEGMNTQSQRQDLEEKKAAWMENLQPIGKNNLVSVPAVSAALANLSNTETITRQFYFDFGQTADQIICFCQSGAAYSVSYPSGTVTKFANAGTFSSSPDLTIWNLQRILIADPLAGYCTWDTVTLVKYGGVSPNIQVTAGGTGYTSGATAAITGGTGSGATATVTVVSGIVTAVNLTNPGSGYVAGDTLTVTISPVGAGSGATATAHIWPIFTIPFQSIAIAFGRVWLSSNNIVDYTGTGATYAGVGYDDFLTADAAGSYTVTDSDLIHKITALRNFNNYLFLVGDHSVKQVGSISVSGSITSFTVVTLSSDQGTTFRDSIISYNRLLVFANTVGVYAVFGTSVEKISDDMDGIFRLINFAIAPIAAINDLNNIHTLLMLVQYKDPVQGQRALILAFMNKKWFVISQGNNLSYLLTAYINGQTYTFSTSGSDITQILSNTAASVSIKLQTSLTSHGTPFMAKKTGRWALSHTSAATTGMTLLLESERISETVTYSAGNPIQFVNNSSANINFTGSGGAALTFFTSGAFQYITGNTQGTSGIYLGMTLTGSVNNFALNSMMLEYQDTAAFGNTQVTLGGL